MSLNKIIKVKPSDCNLNKLLSVELGISKILAQLLINRGISTVKDASCFLHPDINNLADPYLFSDMNKAICLIKKAVFDKSPILVFGDYDVDGVTSVALLKNTLSNLGAHVFHYLPHRIKEGYGLSSNILHICRERNVRLLITVDCGTSSFEQVKQLRHSGIEVIVTDHHEPSGSGILAQPSAMINPKIKGSCLQYEDLAGVGVVYKLCQALTGGYLIDDLDLVCLGTIADVVPLRGENRIIAKFGLDKLTDTVRPGLKALMEKGKVYNKKITSTFVSFILGPRINASGRMDTAETALELMFARCKDSAEELANTLETHNRRRQKEEGLILEEACELVNREINFKEHKIIVVAGNNWHQGVLGIVASKLADRFYRPSIVISKTAHLCKGSGRSIKNFHLFRALTDCHELLETFGGHSHAVGLVVANDKINDFKQKINTLAYERLDSEDLIPGLDIDMKIALSDLDDGLVESLQKLEPFGAGNPEPLFYTAGLSLKSNPQVLSRDTIKFWASDGTATYQVIGFNKASFLSSLVNSSSFDLVYTPRFDCWQGESSIILEIKDLLLK